MSNTITITIDGVEVEAKPGQTILEAAETAGIYIPRLCHAQDLAPHGSCRICTVKANGRHQAACIQPVTPGMVVENNTADINRLRANLIEMLFVEGNHFCMFCEKSGNCELQALAYRLGITAPKYPYLYPVRDLDFSHPDIFIDHNRCILCGRCVRASKDLDGKNVFQFIGRGSHKRIAVNSKADLKGTDIDVLDKAAGICPVGALLPKHTGYKVPVGKRDYDTQPIGSDIEKSAAK